MGDVAQLDDMRLLKQVRVQSPCEQCRSAGFNVFERRDRRGYLVCWVFICADCKRPRVVGA